MNKDFWDVVDGLYPQPANMNFVKLNQEESTLRTTGDSCVVKKEYGKLLNERASNVSNYLFLQLGGKAYKLGNDLNLSFFPNFTTENNLLSGLFIKSTVVYPLLLESDPGCGIMVCKLTGMSKHAFDGIDSKIRKLIPKDIGFVNEITKIELEKSFLKLRCANEISLDGIVYSFSTLGGGNHFIEFLSNPLNNTTMLSVHTGSRLLGERVLNYYIKKAISNSSCNRLLKDAFLLLEDSKKAKIYSTIDKFIYPNLFSELPSNEVQNFYHDMVLVENFAIKNREAIGSKICKELKVAHTSFVHNIHKRVLRGGKMFNMVYSGPNDSVAILFNRKSTYVGLFKNSLCPNWYSNINSNIPYGYDEDIVVKDLIKKPICYQPFHTIQYGE